MELIKHEIVTQEDVKNTDITSEDGCPLIKAGMHHFIFQENENTCETYIKNEVVERLGIEYIIEHAAMEYSSVTEQWVFSMSEDDYYNDPVRFPPCTKKVEFLYKPDLYSEIYKDVEGEALYLREIYVHKGFIKWYRCIPNSQDTVRIRANVTFINIQNGETETITYRDWNDYGVYDGCKTFARSVTNTKKSLPFNIKTANPCLKFYYKNNWGQKRYFKVLEVLDKPDSTGNNVRLCAIGETAEEYMQNHAVCLKNNPCNKDLHNRSSEEICTIHVEFAWFDNRKIIIMN